MRLEALFAALVLFGDLAGPAQADLRGQPQFSAAESQTIARNELLNAVVAADPWLVRRMLDIIAHENARADAVRGTPCGRPGSVDYAPRLAGHRRMERTGQARASRKGSARKTSAHPLQPLRGGNGRNVGHVEERGKGQEGRRGGSVRSGKTTSLLSTPMAHREGEGVQGVGRRLMGRPSPFVGC